MSLDTDFSLLQNDEADEIWKFIKDKILKGCNKFIPLKGIINFQMVQLENWTSVQVQSYCLTPSMSITYSRLSAQTITSLGAQKFNLDFEAIYEQKLVNNFLSNPRKLYQHHSSYSDRFPQSTTIFHESSPLTGQAKFTLFNNYIHFTITRGQLSLLLFPLSQLVVSLRP